jgi:glycosyltransferase involved in cell wall biosynthesis
MGGKNICIITEIYYPEETSTSHILTNIAEGIADEFKVQVICGPSDYTGTVIEAPKSEIHNNVRIERCNIVKFNKNNIFKRILRSLLISMLLTLKAFLKINRNDTVLVVTNPFTIVFFISWVCRLKKADLVILVHDVFPNNLLAANIINKDSILYAVLDRLTCYAFKQAKSIIVIGRDMRELLKRKIGNDAIQIDVICNWADVNEIIPAEKELTELYKKMNLTDKFIVLFAGNLGRVQGIEYLVEAAEKLKTEEVHFVFIGNGAKVPAINELILSKRIENICLIGNLPRSEQKDFLNACDVGIVSLAPGMFGLGVPSKAYNIMSAGKPIIAMVEQNSEIGLLVREEKVGWVVPPGDSDGLITAIREAKDNPLRLRTIGTRARKVAESKYSREKIIDNYKKFFKKLQSL